ncbi:hypothetical protein M8C17_21045 [Micromonospora sp. RHAY321]|uniref:hypothetical protein n=1 Tax=Micromonospora sp. RHAY321 TaxID=2944807 RepID=UPI00207D0728|nr:hypothetical protein [Micromonospora sp. RHAY321]MCO1597642.1 hypothetical protein [Micromonospora sp. RHAY321]
MIRNAMIRNAMIVMPLLALPLTACTGNADKPNAAASSTSAAPSAVAPPSAAASPTAQAPDGQKELRQAVLAYSDAFLDAKPTVAYDLFSARCKDRVTLSEFTGMLAAAKQIYGKAMPLKTFDAQISGDLARATYTYDVPALNQTKEPWVREDGKWKQDDC